MRVHTRLIQDDHAPRFDRNFNNLDSEYKRQVLDFLSGAIELNDYTPAGELELLMEVKIFQLLEGCIFVECCDDYLWL